MTFLFYDKGTKLAQIACCFTTKATKLTKV